MQRGHGKSEREGRSDRRGGQKALKEKSYIIVTPPTNTPVLQLWCRPNTTPIKVASVYGRKS